MRKELRDKLEPKLERNEQLTREAVEAALKVLDAALGEARSSDPHGDQLAYALDALILKAVDERTHLWLVREPAA